MIAGQVGLVRYSRGWVGKVVEWCTDSTSHHVVIAVSPTECVSADLPRVVIRPSNSFHSMEWSRFELTEEQVQAITAAAAGMVGRPYNVAAIALLLASKLTSVPIPKFAVDWLNRRPHVDCSHLADVALAAGGLDLFLHDAALTVPAHFEHLFRERAWIS